MNRSHTKKEFRFIGKKRLVREDHRFVKGQGRFIADIKLPNTLHLALLPSPYPSAKIIRSNKTKALMMPGVAEVIFGDELAAATSPLVNAVDTPNINCYPLANGEVKYVGEWVAAAAATSRQIAEDAIEALEVEYEPKKFVIDPEIALNPDSPPVHSNHGSNILYQHKFVWGDVKSAFSSAPNRLAFQAKWGRSSTVPLETFGVLANWNEPLKLLDIWASVQMPSYPEQIAAILGVPINSIRVHYDVDVGGSYGVKRGIKHTALACYLTRKLKKPVRLIEDRLENLIGGDAHGPDRLFNIEVAFEDDGLVKALRLRAIEDVGAQTGRAPFQLGKPIGAIVGPYTIGAVQYEPICVSTNKTGQTAVRGFGQSPTNFAIEMALDKVARYLHLDRVTVRQKNFIKTEQFPYRIPSGSLYDSGDYHTVLKKGLDLANMKSLVAERESIRKQGLLAGIGIATCLEPGGGNSSFEPLLNPKNRTTTWPDSCKIIVGRGGDITAFITTSSSGQGHETLVSTIIGEELNTDPNVIKVMHADSLTGLPSNSPVGSRMAIMLGGAAAGASKLILKKVFAIAAYNLDSSPSDLSIKDGIVSHINDSKRCISWEDVALIAHRYHHQMPPGTAPGIQASFVLQVPLGGSLPDDNSRVQMYPCYSFAAHIVTSTINPHTGQIKLPKYFVAHDCGTVINPDIVNGMIIGGVAHGIGAALYEKFQYNQGGQMISGSFQDYLIPSAHELPRVELVEHCTPSPLTSHGQKGVGEGGYLGAPAAVASAVNDALAEHKLELFNLPLRAVDIELILRKNGINHARQFDSDEFCSRAL